MTSREWKEFQRTVLGEKDVSTQAGITADTLLRLGGTHIAEGLDQLLRTPLTSSREPLSTRNAATTVPTLPETISALTDTLVPGGQRHNNLLSTAFGLAPLMRGLFSVFHRNDPRDAVQPIHFSLPAPLRTEAAMSADHLTFNIDRGMGDRIRPLRASDSSVSSDTSGVTGGASTPSAVNNITVQVNAIDSRSFLDHSEDIARAVRNAMLHSNALNDVVNDL